MTADVREAVDTSAEQIPAAAQPEPDTAVPVLRIQATPGWRAVNFRELWRYRELLYFLVWRDLKVRYKQTVLGVAWAVIQPLGTMLVFSLFFGKWAKIPSDGIPYPLFSFAALLPWMYFSNALTLASNSLVGSSHLITKIYFPRLLIPTGMVLAGLVDFGIGLLGLGGVMLALDIVPPLQAAVPIVLLAGLTSALALAVGLWLSALNVQYRDVRYVVPFLVQLWMFASPVIYPLTLVPEPYRWLVRLNPITGIIEGFRASLFQRPMDLSALGLSVLITLLVLVSGLFYFRRVERTFADVV